MVRLGDLDAMAWIHALYLVVMESESRRRAGRAARQSRVEPYLEEARRRRAPERGQSKEQ